MVAQGKIFTLCIYPLASWLPPYAPPNTSFYAFMPLSDNILSNNHCFQIAMHKQKLHSSHTSDVYKQIRPLCSTHWGQTMVKLRYQYSVP